MNWQPQLPQCILEARASLYQQIRDFFRMREVLEVETPILNRFSVTDQHIESISTEHFGYLQTSPEYAMKRLLTLHQRDIFQLCKVFRSEEQGRNHHFEFTMLEWYRVGWRYEDLIQEVEALINLVLKELEISNSICISYKKLFIDFTDIDIVTADQAEYLRACSDHGINLTSSLSIRQYQELVLDQIIIPKLNKNIIYFVNEFPKQQSSLAKINEHGFAERFECYLNGMELANGFQELTDADEQQARFEEDNRRRLLANKKAMEIDTNFIAALNTGLPESAGVALGVDRLLMLKVNASHINEVLAFPNG